MCPWHCGKYSVRRIKPYNSGIYILNLFFSYIHLASKYLHSSCLCNFSLQAILKVALFSCLVNSSKAENCIEEYSYILLFTSQEPDCITPFTVIVNFCTFAFYFAESSMRKKEKYKIRVF